MAEPKARTHIQQLGFFDQDLNSSTHDQIMIWLQDNMERVLNDLFYSPIEQWEIREMINRTKTRLQENIPELIRSNQNKSNFHEYADFIEKLQKWDGAEILKKTWEKPRISEYSVKWEFCVERTGRTLSDKFTLGFIDMAVKYSIPNYKITGIPGNVISQRSLSEYSVPRLVTTSLESNVYFEIKTKIQSVGALLRQINFYKSYKPGTYVIVCPDDRFKDILASQGVGFLKAFE